MNSIQERRGEALRPDGSGGGGGAGGGRLPGPSGRWAPRRAARLQAGHREARGYRGPGAAARDLGGVTAGLPPRAGRPACARSNPARQGGTGWQCGVPAQHRVAAGAGARAAAAAGQQPQLRQQRQQQQANSRNSNGGGTSGGGSGGHHRRQANRRNDGGAGGASKQQHQWGSQPTWQGPMSPSDQAMQSANAFAWSAHGACSCTSCCAACSAGQGGAGRAARCGLPAMRHAQHMDATSGAA